MLISKISKIINGRVIVKDKVTIDAVNYYDIIVMFSRGRDDVKGHKELTKRQVQNLLGNRKVAFDESEFNKAYHEFKKARTSRSVFQKDPQY